MSLISIPTGGHTLKTSILVEQGRICDGKRIILDHLNFKIDPGACTVILGPSGTGKSVLLHAIAQSLPPKLETHGKWSFPSVKGDAVHACILRQPKSEEGSTKKQHSAHLDSVQHWRQALIFAEGPIFLDEPVSGLQPEEMQHFVRFYKSLKQKPTVVLITHNLLLAKAIADQVIFICASKLEYSGDASTFFATPPTPMATQFLKTGNCWPQPEPPPLPKHFEWIIPGQLAGMGRPGLLGDPDTDLAAIGMAGITDLVSLTETPYPAKALRSYAIRGTHFPIRDMGVPSLNSAATLIGRMARRMTSDGAVVTYHCKAGLGRTGTILACHLAWIGMDPAEAIESIRQKRSGYIQTKTQQDFVFNFAQRYCKVKPNCV